MTYINGIHVFSPGIIPGSILGNVVALGCFISIFLTFHSTLTAFLVHVNCFYCLFAKFMDHLILLYLKNNNNIQVHFDIDLFLLDVFFFICNFN